MEYEWYAWIQKLTIKEKRRVPSCLGWDLQNSWNCWDQQYLLIVLGRKNDWPPAYFLFIVGISLHGGFSCTRFTREHKQKREVALYSCCASQKPLNYWYQEIKQSCTGRMIFPVLIFPRFRQCQYIACNRFTREHKKKRERWHHVPVWCFKAFELLGFENEIMFGLKNDWAPAYFHQFCRHQFAKCFLMQLFHQRTQRKERGGILFELDAPRTFE